MSVPPKAVDGSLGVFSQQGMLKSPGAFGELERS